MATFHPSIPQVGRIRRPTCPTTPPVSPPASSSGRSSGCMGKGQRSLGGRRAGTPYPPLHVMAPHHLNGVCGHSDQVRRLSGPVFSLSVDFSRRVGRRRATRCAPTVLGAQKMSRGGVSEHRLVRKCYHPSGWPSIHPSGTEKVLLPRAPCTLPIRAPVSPPSARPPPTTKPGTFQGRGAGDRSLHGCGSDGCRWFGCPDCMGRAVRGAAWGVRKRVDPGPF